MIRHNNYENKNLLQTIKTFSHYQQVSFALYCAKEVESLANDPRIIDCNLAVERWLKGDQSVDLEIAKNNALNAWSDAAYSAASAYYAAYTTVRVADTSAAYSADFAAYYSAYSADFAAYYSAYYSTRAKSYNLYPNNNEQSNIACEQFLNEYKQIAQNWLSLWEIPNFPKDEPDFPIFDYLIDMNLISCLLPKKENYYYLNLNGFNIKHVNEAELLKEIDTMHIKNILRRIINNDLPQQL